MDGQGRTVSLSVCFSGALPRRVAMNLKSPHVPRGLTGKKVLFATDLHYGRWMGDKPMGRIVDLMLEQNADLILLGGDLAEGLEAQRRLCRRHLPRLKAPMGLFCVPGNNDWEAVKGDYRLWGRMLAEAGVTLLVNRRVYLAAEGGRLALSGLDESKYGRPDPAVVQAPLDENDLHLLLTHSPWALAPLLRDGGRVELALCGHTHGGQIALGACSALAMGYRHIKDRPYFFMSGDHVVGEVRVLVSNGIGCSLMPLRIGAPPQLHLIRLG